MPLLLLLLVTASVYGTAAAAATPTIEADERGNLLVTDARNAEPSAVATQALLDELDAKWQKSFMALEAALLTSEDKAAKREAGLTATIKAQAARIDKLEIRTSTTQATLQDEISTLSGSTALLPSCISKFVGKDIAGCPKPDEKTIRCDAYPDLHGGSIKGEHGVASAVGTVLLLACDTNKLLGTGEPRAAVVCHSDGRWSDNAKSTCTSTTTSTTTTATTGPPKTFVHDFTDGHNHNWMMHNGWTRDENNNRCEAPAKQNQMTNACMSHCTGKSNADPVHGEQVLGGPMCVGGNGIGTPSVNNFKNVYGSLPKPTTLQRTYGPKAKEAALPSHRKITLSFEVWFIDNWLNNRVYLKVEGVQVWGRVMQKNFAQNNMNGNGLVSGHYCGKINFDQYRSNRLMIGDTPVADSITVAHTSDSLVVEFGSTLAGNPAEATWGLKYFNLTVA